MTRLPFPADPLVDPDVLQGAHLVLDCASEKRIVDPQAQFDVALLCAQGDIGARHNEDLVVDDEELGVVAHTLALVIDGRA